MQLMQHPMNRINSAIALIIFFVMINYIESQTFKQQQLKFNRVKTAYNKKEDLLKKIYLEKGIKSLGCSIFFRAFKETDEFELWAKDTKLGRYILIKKYDICSKSGTLGPKRIEGDGQVPEGFYII